ncbi:MAG: DUF1080 domain-containing protein, partial [candidate division KSB1 bacterium]|nr:DUF1080 domain-containing protein [candidate division KSB1 bacterium]
MAHLLSLVSLVIFLVGSAISAGDPVMGDWEGTYTTDAGQSGSLYAQVIVEDVGTYRAIIQIGYQGPKVELMGKKKGKKTVFTGQVDVGYDLGGIYNVTAEVVDSRFTGRFSGAENAGSLEMRKVSKTSPTLGAKPPEGAIVLFDGSSLKAWQQVDGKPARWKILREGAMEVTRGNIITRQKFGDCQLHVEFRTPFMPRARRELRGNSGVYLQRRYEVQILDSYGLEPTDNGCGSIYKVAAPQVNASLPPLEWQTYDIIFYAPKFDDAGNKIKDAEITVK